MLSQNLNQLFDKDDETLLKEVLEYWELSEPVLIGQYTPVNNKPYGFFNDVKNSDGKLLSYPKRFGDVSVYIHQNDLELGTYYQFSVCLASQKQRQEKRNPFLIQTDTQKNILKIGNPQKWVQELFENTGKSWKDAGDLSRSLKKIAGDLYTEAERFIFKLLQNADDFLGESGKVQTQFVLFQEHLLFLHDGKSFTQREVEALSSIGDSTKSKDSSTTGYKGIGFKSVFTDSDCVYVNSGNYRFRYDKSYYQNSKQTPWEIKPIWTERDDLPQEIREYTNFFQYSVSIALRVGSQKVDEYRQRIRELFSEPRFMLFLRHVVVIDVSGLSKGLKISLKLDRFENFSQIYYNGNVKSKWLVKDIEFDVPLEVRSQIENDQKVPKKLQEATRTKLSFAAKIEDDKIVSLRPQESVLFTYLPTNVKDYQFPFLVNANFLTTANREDLHRDNDWNAFIFERLAYHFFEFLQWIPQTEKHYQKYIIDLIPNRFTSSSEKIAKYFNKGFEQALQEIAFIPSEETEELLKVNEAIIDETEITQIIEHQIVKSVLGIQKYFVSKELENASKLKRLGVEIFDFAKLVKFLRSYSFDSEKECEYLTILKHLKKMKYESKLREEAVPIILDENGNLIASTSDNHIYFQPSEDDKALLTFDEFIFIASELDSISKENSDIHNCLESLGVKEFKPIEIIKDRIKKRKYEPKDNSVKAHVNHIRFIFKYRSHLTDTESQKLSNLKILHKIGNRYYLSVASECYLSDYYQPDYPLESLAEELETDIFKFIAPDYCENNQDILAWKEFFIKVKIIKPDGLNIISNFIVPIIKDDNVNLSNTVKITRFIFSVLKNNVISNSKINDNLNNLLLKTNNGLKPAKECYLSEFYSPISQGGDFIKEIKLPNLVSNEYCKNNESLEVWRQFFLNLGVEEVKGIELIQRKISLLNNDIITSDNIIRITREIFNHRHQLTEDDFEVLSKLKVFLKNGKFALADECYLSNEYKPVQDLDSLFINTGFTKILSAKYITQNSEAWKDFFTKIGVGEKIKVYFTTERQSESFTCDIARAYLQFLNINKSIQYKFKNIIFVSNFSDYSNNYDFSQKIWQYFNTNWDRLNLGINTTIWNNRVQLKTVPSIFKFLATQYPSIPCTDKKCRKPSEVYSYSLQSSLTRLPISAIELPAKIEEFLGIKRSLDVEAYLEILEILSSNFSSEHDSKKLLIIYDKLSKLIATKISNDDKELINQWKIKGKLLGYDDLLHPIEELYYIDSEMALPYKRNAHLIREPENLTNKDNFEFLLDFLGVTKITWNDIEVYYNNEINDSLPRLIRERVNYISIYLINSTTPELVEEKSDKILESLNQVKINKVSELYYSVSQINYTESIYNFYDTDNLILYVGSWNNRKNAKIGEYLIKALELDPKKITSERLLDFLDDPIEDVIKYLTDSGYNVPENKPNYNILTNGQGTGNDAENWGKWGEEQARLFYEKLNYTVVKQPDRVGYDFLCKKPDSQLCVEVKTINPLHNDVIRITRNEWNNICKSENINKYELLVVIHKKESVEKIIRVKSAWLTLQEVLSRLNQHILTMNDYNSKNIEVLIGFQRSSNHQSNDLIFNWKRLLEEASSWNSNIEEYDGSFLHK